MHTTYRLRAGGHTLTAHDLAELAELIECAIDAGDRIESVRTADGRPLTDEEFRQLLEQLAAPAPHDRSGWSAAHVG